MNPAGAGHDFPLRRSVDGSMSGVKARTQVLADWAEARLHETLDFAPSADRLYGATIVDHIDLADGAAGAARLSFLGEVDDLGAFLGARIVLELGNFDAAVLLAGRWLTDDLAGGRPGEYGARRRARVVMVGDDGGVAATVRFAHRPEHPEHRQAGGAECAVLRALWSAARR
jgi:hypothetical protein